jgi:murein DD-endopeptidase MepM/ murein hydrolase activator NlpD
MLRSLVILLIGLLIGANIVYFVMTRSSRVRHAPAAPVATAVVTTPDPQSGPRKSLPAEASPSSSPASAVATTAVPTTPAPVASEVPTSTAPEGTTGPAGLIVPVSGIAATTLVDSYHDARGTERVHEALDIMAPAGTPVLAAADGSIEKLFTSDKGGLTIYQFEPGGRYVYYYAHLQRYAPGLAEKQQVKQGDVIGYVGSTGNADPAAPHLHFGVSVLGPERQWWKSTPIDPYPLLRRR